VKAWVAVLVLGGCDRVLGVDPLSIPIDAPGRRITGDYTWSAADVSSGTPVEVDSFPSIADEAMSAAVPGGAAVPVDRTDTGFGFSVPLATSYSLDVQASDEDQPTEVQGTAPEIHLRRSIFQRSDATYPSRSMPITINATLLNPTLGFARVASAGVRTFMAPIKAGIATVIIDWLQSGVGLVETSKGDRLVYEHWVYDAANQYAYITEAKTLPIEMVDGSSYSFTTPVNALVPDRCVHLQTKRATLLAQLTMDTGLTVNAQGGWGIYTVPLSTLEPGAASAVALNATAPADDDLQVSYSSVLGDLADVALVSVAVGKTIALPGTSSPLTLYASVGFFDLVTPTAPSACAANVVALDRDPLPLMTSAQLAGVSLSVDVQAITSDRTQPVVFDFAATPGAYDDIYYSLDELVANPPATNIQHVRTFVGAKPLLIDPSLLHKRHSYIITVVLRRGYPGASKLDYRQVSFPFGNSATFTTVFDIAN
jgi:hypothetical protein